MTNPTASATRNNVEGKRHVRTLFETVVFSDVCSGCAACVVACPVGVTALDYERGVDHPVLLDACIDCQLCYKACPRMEYQTEEIQKNAFGPDLPTINPDFGPCLEVWGARARSDTVMGVAQDGGVVTAMLGWALDEGLLDGVITSGREGADFWKPVPKVVTSREELLACAGSVYTYVPNVLAVQESNQRGLKRTAFVGTPCEISGVRKLEIAKSKASRKSVESIVLNIGLMCSETFDYEPFMMDKIVNGLGVPLEEITKINIKGKVLVYLKSGEVKVVSLKECKAYARPGCHYCQDFGGEEADISCGGLGLDGWTIVMLRSQRGKEWFDKAVEAGVIEKREPEEFAKSLDLYVKLATKQRARPKRNEHFLLDEEAHVARIS